MLTVCRQVDVDIKPYEGGQTDSFCEEFGDSLKFLSWNKFDDYIRSLKKYEKDKRIVYPTNGELYDKIQAAMNK